MNKEYRDAYLDGYVKGLIALQIRSLRKELKLSQKDFAEKTKKKQSVISRLEDTEYGSVSINTLLDVAKALDIALDVRFASYPSILDADVSPQAFVVESVFISYSNVVSTATQKAPSPLPPITMRDPTMVIVHNNKSPAIMAGRTGMGGSS